MQQETLQECLVGQIRDLYDAEKQLTRALPKLAKAAESEELSEGLQEHLRETQGQVQRLENVFKLLGLSPRGKPCKGMRGLIEEGNEVIEELDGAPLDLAIIAGAQRVEHYEISAYGTARTMAEQMGNSRAAQLLQETEEEEKAADTKLTEIAMALYQMEDEDSESMVTEGEEGNGRRRPARSGNGARRARRAS